MAVIYRQHGEELAEELLRELREDAPGASRASVAYAAVGILEEALSYARRVLESERFTADEDGEEV